MPDIHNSSPQQILSIINGSGRILINMDTRTDIDAICSAKLIKWWLEKLGKKSDIIHSQNITQGTGRYFDCSDIKQNTDIASVNLSNYNLVIFVDSGTASHISLIENYHLPSKITTLNIDHHSSNDYFGKLNYVLKIGSCCSVIYQLFQELKVTLDEYSRRLLAFGIITDTGFFNFDSTQPQDFRIIADLADQGVKVYEIMNTLKNSESLDQIKYKNLVYSNLIVSLDKKCAFSTITLDEINNLGIDMDKVYIRHSDLIKYLDGVDFTFVIAETKTDPKMFELSLRSQNPSIDVSKMAELFGGGGHITGAGAKIFGVNTIEDALKLVKIKLNLT